MISTTRKKPARIAGGLCGARDAGNESSEGVGWSVGWLVDWFGSLLWDAAGDV